MCDGISRQKFSITLTEGLFYFKSYLGQEWLIDKKYALTNNCRVQCQNPWRGTVNTEQRLDNYLEYRHNYNAILNALQNRFCSEINTKSDGDPR